MNWSTCARGYPAEACSGYSQQNLEELLARAGISSHVLRYEGLSTDELPRTERQR